jgi:beta-N-acetylhexosaminidase
MKLRFASLAALLLVAACSSQVPTPAPSLLAIATPGASASEIAAGPTFSPLPTTVPTIGPTFAPATAPPTPPPTPEPTPTGPTLTQLVGQKLMVAMSGTSPSTDLLGRIRRGEVGGVILFGSNISTATQVRALTSKLQAAATAGGQPRLLISTDQEGGSVKRIPWAPPTMSPPQMGASGSAATARSQGQQTGSALKALGINLDLAPVADVPLSTSSFMYQQGRTWSFSAATTTSLADAFAAGLEAGKDVPSMKHFPGIGRATLNTDSHVDTITASAATLDSGLDPYRGAIAQGIPMVMLSNAWYTAWDPNSAAGWSRAIGTTLLRDQLGFTGVTITDSLSGIAGAMGVSATSLAIKAAEAGTDIILVTGSEASTKATFKSLLAAATAGSVARARLLTSYDRILALKATPLVMP